MTQPFFEEEYRWYDIELYNVDEVAGNGGMANIKKYTSEILPPLKQIATRAKELGYDTFDIKEKIEIHRGYNVEDFDVTCNWEDSLPDEEYVNVRVIKPVGYHDDHEVGEIIRINKEHQEMMLKDGYIEILEN